MRRTQRFRDQHRQLLGMAGELLMELNKPGASGDSLRRLLSELGGTLRVHLAMEDSFYPRLQVSSRPALVSMANRFQQEMQGLRQEVEVFLTRWGSGTAIAADRARFAGETRALLEALRERIAREENQFFPAIDEADEISQVAAMPRPDGRRSSS